MKHTRNELSGGLRLMWIEECSALTMSTAGTLALILPAFAPDALELIVLLTLAATLVGFVGAAMGLAGLWRLRGEHRDYKIALAVAVVRLICAIFRPRSMGMPASALGLAIALFALLVVYLVVRTTNDFLSGDSQEPLRTEGKQALCVWAVATVVSLASNAWAVMSAGKAGGWIRVVITQTIVIVSEALYLIYLKHSSEALA